MVGLLTILLNTATGPNDLNAQSFCVLDLQLCDLKRDLDPLKEASISPPYLAAFAAHQISLYSQEQHSLTVVACRTCGLNLQRV